MVAAAIIRMGGTAAAPSANAAVDITGERAFSPSETTWPTYLNIRLLLTSADRDIGARLYAYSTTKHVHSRQDDI
jgi:hypothetical protein